MSNIIKANPVPEKSKDADLQIISFNLRCSGEGDTSVATRAPLLCAQLKEFNADSIGMQEATPEWMDLLQQLISDKYAYVGVGREDGAVKGEYNPIFYRKDKFSLVNSGTIWLSAKPDKPGSRYLGSACPRICTWAVLRNNSDDKTFVHINTHLDHVSERARLKQADVLLKKIAVLRKYGPVICTGDFNVDEGAPVYKKMCESMTDCKFTAPETDSCGTYHGYEIERIETTPPIDFGFITGDFKPLVYRVIRDKINDIFLSDHFGLYFELAY